MRNIYHYWYHTGENMAIRQQLGHMQLPEYVGDIDAKADLHFDKPFATFFPIGGL